VHQVLEREKKGMDAAELIAVIRDLTIILFAGVGVLVLLLLTVWGLRAYRKVKHIQDSARATVKQAQEASLPYNAGRIVAFIMGLSKGKGGGKKDG
jgi:hypothetical protein